MEPVTRRQACRTAVYFLAMLTAVMLCLVPAGCNQHQAETDSLFQVSTLGALLVGIYDGEATYADLAEKGDFGLGTFNALDGEMICLDGIFYQIRTDGNACPVDSSQKAPFANLAFFRPDATEALQQLDGYESLKAYLDSRLKTVNVPCAVRVDGTFSFMKARSVSAQEQPYPPLADAVAGQTVFEFHDVQGTMVGFRMPAYMDGGINVSGYHFHFITGDRTAGGHVLECAVDRASAAIDYLHDVTMVLPGDDAFYAADLDSTDAGRTERLSALRDLL